MSATIPRMSACLSWLAALTSFALAACQGATITPNAAPVAAPKLAVGDHWQYRITDNLRRGEVSRLDAEVIAVAGGTARIRLDYADASVRSEWIDEVDGEGALSSGTLWREPPRPFDPPAQLLAFPLADGKTWRQVIDTMRKDTEIKDQVLIYGKVDGRKATMVPAGAYDAFYIYRIVQLDDEEFWRTRTIRRDAVWYAPEVKAPVREAREAEYTERSSGQDATTVRTESTVFELLSFRPGTK